MGLLRSRPLSRAAIAALILVNAAAPQDAVIRVNVRLVRMLVTVKDNAGRLVGFLNRDDFDITDNGARQDVAIFERQTEQPLSVSVLVDTSASTGKDIRYELDSVSRFLHTLFDSGNAYDSAALYSFNWQVQLHTSFTRRMLRFEQGMRALKPEGGTSLYDALYLAGQDLENREGRHVMIVVTDGGDTTSRKSYHEALEALQRADTILFPIVVIPITNMAGRNIGGENALTTLAEGTGGRIFLPSSGPELDTAFTEILRELRTQYLIGFYPKDVPLTRNRFHTLKVGLKRQELRVSTRTGYYGESER